MMAGGDDLEALAGEYVLGTLSAEERLAVQQRLLDSPDLARLVAEWEDRLAPLAEDQWPYVRQPGRRTNGFLVYRPLIYDKMLSHKKPATWRAFLLTRKVSGGGKLISAAAHAESNPA